MLKTIASVRMKEGNAFHTVLHPGPVGQELPPGHEGKAVSVDTAQLCPCQADILVSKQATDQEQGGINKRKMLALSALSGPRQPRLPWRRTYLQPKG